MSSLILWRLLRCDLRGNSLLKDLRHILHLSLLDFWDLLDGAWSGSWIDCSERLMCSLILSSTLWTDRTCLRAMSFLTKDVPFPQSLQLNLTFLWTELMCWVRFPLDVKSLLQDSHFNDSLSSTTSSSFFSSVTTLTDSLFCSVMPVLSFGIMSKILSPCSSKRCVFKSSFEGTFLPQ